MYFNKPLVSMGSLFTAFLTFPLLLSPGNGAAEEPIPSIWEVTVLGGLSIDKDSGYTNYRFNFPNSDVFSPNYRVAKWKDDQVYFQGALTHTTIGWKSDDEGYLESGWGQLAALAGAGYAIVPRTEKLSPFIEGEVGILSLRYESDYDFYPTLSGTAGIRYFLRPDISLRSHLRTAKTFSSDMDFPLRVELGIGLSVLPGAK